MGCAASRFDKDERVQICKQRKRLMKQLVGFRGEFADAQLAYLKALKNTGVTLRQFTESELLEFENSTTEGTTERLVLPPSPPPPPPPPPPLEETDEEEIKKSEYDGLQFPPIISSSLEWDPFRSTTPCYWENEEMMEPVDEENWAETKTDFEEEESEEKASTTDVVATESLSNKLQNAGSVDDNSSTTSWCDKDNADGTAVFFRGKKSLEALAKELDDYFLKASAGVKEITVLMDINGSDMFLPHSFRENKRKGTNPAKVFSGLSWSRSSRSLTEDSVDSSEPCRPGAHCVTLKKLCDEEQKLYKAVKEEVKTKLELEKKSLLLQKQEAENHDWEKTDKTRQSVGSLEAIVSQLQEIIRTACSSILQLIDENLYPQLIAITSGLLQMWRTMYESHEAQYRKSQLLMHLGDNQKMDPSTANHRQAAVQLETEVSCWYNSFCRVVNSQREYVRTLFRWIKLVDNLVDEDRRSLHLSAVQSLCDQWQLALDKLPDKAASEAIKGLCSAIHSIVVQQVEEHNLQRKYEKIDRRVQKEMDSRDELLSKLQGSFEGEDMLSDLSPKHPLTLKDAKIAALQKQLEIEKTQYQNSVQATKAMTLNNLKTSLPNVFKTLVDFSGANVEAIEACLSYTKPEDTCEAELESTQN
ncbi:hypothetical protein CsatB_001732 [Cannabis sativa]